jgi:hypothetical protein
MGNNKPNNGVNEQRLFDDEPLCTHMSMKDQKQLIELRRLEASFLLNPFFLIKKKINEVLENKKIKPIQVNFIDIGNTCEMVHTRQSKLKKVAQVLFIFKHTSEPYMFAIRPNGYKFKISSFHSFQWKLLVTNNEIIFKVETQCFSKIFNNELFNEIERFKKEIIANIKLSIASINEEIEMYNNSLYVKELKSITERKRKLLMGVKYTSNYISL